MIVRILQLNVRPDRIQQFLEVIAARVQQGVQGADGLLGWEVLAPLEQPPVTVVITRWRDEDAVRTWAGPFWRQRACRHRDRSGELPGPQLRSLALRPARR